MPDSLRATPCQFSNMIRFISICLLTLAAAHISSQICGTTITSPVPDWYHALLSNEQITPRSSSIDTVGLAVHVIETASGTDGLYEQFSEALDWVNMQFADAGLYFFICEWEELEGDPQFTFDKLDALNTSHYIDHRLNIYFVERIEDFGINIGGVGIMPWLGKREERYVALVHIAPDYPTLIAHEIGHFYGLFHTHEIFNGREHVARTNCTTTGDLLCDTPADPGLGAHNVHNCIYQGNTLDPRGMAYIPETDLIMSYAPHTCRDRFSDEQLLRMRQNAVNIYHDMVSDCYNLRDIALSTTYSPVTISFLDTLFIPVDITHDMPVSSQVEIAVTLLHPVSGDEILLHAESVILDPNNLEFSHNVRVVLPTGVIRGEQHIIVKVDAGRQFIESDERNNTVNLSFTIDNARFDNVILIPNPVLDELIIFYRNIDAGGQIHFEIYDTQGRSLMHANSLKPNFEFYDRLDVSGLIDGIYFLRIIVPKGDISEVVTFVKN